MTYDYRIHSPKPMTLAPDRRAELEKLLGDLGGHDGWVRANAEDGELAWFAARPYELEIESEEAAARWQRLLAIVDGLGCELEDVQTKMRITPERIRVNRDLERAYRIVTDTVADVVTAAGFRAAEPHVFERALRDVVQRLSIAIRPSQIRPDSEYGDLWGDVSIGIELVVCVDQRISIWDRSQPDPGPCQFLTDDDLIANTSVVADDLRALLIPWLDARTDLDTLLALDVWPPVYRHLAVAEQHRRRGEPALARAALEAFIAEAEIASDAFRRDQRELAERFGSAEEPDPWHEPIARARARL
jgi:hypothetical protein